jgi:hypothetical protein
VPDNLSKYVSLFSLAAFAAVTIFNVGYFSVVGPHFLGLMDITNVIYSIGLAFLILFVVVELAILAAAIFRDFDIRNIERANEIAFWVSIVIPLVISAIVLFRAISSIKGIDFIDMVLISVVCVAVYWWTFIGWKLTGELRFARAASSGLISFVAIFLAGMYSASQQAYQSKIIYNVQTKGGNFLHVRLVRTSSNGVLICDNGKFLFVPSSELKLIIAGDL